MITYGSTFKGIRSENQDRFLIYTPSEDFSFLAVADGMGGAVGGGIASQIVIETVEKVIRIYYEDWKRDFDLKDILFSIYSEAQKAIRNKISKEPELNSMGTTLCCLLISNNRYVWGNIGDSRLYLLTKTNCSKLTLDHTPVEEFYLREGKKASGDFIANYENMLTKVINGSNEKPDIYPSSSPFCDLKINEGFLLCSDGLLLQKHGNEGKLFHDYFLRSKSLKEFADSLIINAYEMGSNDNITCVAAVREN